MSEIKTYTCPYHNISGLLSVSENEAERLGLKSEECNCPKCIEEYKNLPDVDLMEPQKRADEVKWWFDERGSLTIPFSLISRRISDLVGRPVWTTEFALNRVGLIKEALERGCVHQDNISPEKMKEINDQLPDREIITVVVPEDKPE